MNQILITEKLYVTPEIRRKKKLYKLQFIFSIILVCLLFSYYIYANYDRNKSEAVSKEILEGIQISSEPVTENIEQNENIKEKKEDNTVKKYDGMIVIAIEDDEELDSQIIEQPQEQQSLAKTYTTANGDTYLIDATLNIPRLGIKYPVLADWSEELLKISINKYWGPEPNEVGNYCIIGHNYRSGKMFGNLPAITNGDIIELTDTKYGRTIKYEVYDRKQINPDDTSCTSQLTGGKKEITLITCKEYGTQRLVVKAREVK